VVDVRWTQSPISRAIRDARFGIAGSRMSEQRSGIRAAVVAALMLAATATAAALLASASPRAQAAPGAAADRLWFAPSPGSVDYLDLFSHPDEWPLARQLISVFKFYQQH